MNTKTLEQLNISLPAGFTVRGATLEDLDAAIALYNRWSQSIIHEDEITDSATVRTEWVSPGFDVAEDIRLVFAPNGEMVGYVEVWTTNKPPVHPWIWARVDPRYEGLGIGTYLTTWAEMRAQRALAELAPDLRFAPQVGTYQKAEAAKKLFIDLGYKYIRSGYTMRIDMDVSPIASVFPKGITLRTFNPEADLKMVYRAVNESFSDHYGHVEAPFEEGLQRFKHFMTGYEGFDPTMWFLAMDGEEIAGICLCREKGYDNPNVGWVNTLGVCRAWRKRGIGLALLRYAFGELYRRGQRKAGLGVDAQNLTGALRLYENVGMYVYMAFDRYEKELRPGQEISVQSL